jgi:hypothetical protein
VLKTAAWVERNFSAGPPASSSAAAGAAVTIPSEPSIEGSTWDPSAGGGNPKLFQRGSLSSGIADVRGRFDVFTEISVAFNELNERYDEIKSKYNELNKTIRGNGLLRNTERFDPTGPIAEHVLLKTQEFAVDLHLNESQLILELTHRNSLSFARIILSYFRTLERYYVFCRGPRERAGTDSRASDSFPQLHTGLIAVRELDAGVFEGGPDGPQRRCFGIAQLEIYALAFGHAHTQPLHFVLPGPPRRPTDIGCISIFTTNTEM